LEYPLIRDFRFTKRLRPVRVGHLTVEIGADVASHQLPAKATHKGGVANRGVIDLERHRNGGHQTRWDLPRAQQFNIAIDSRTEIDVEEGVTREGREEVTATNNVPGHSMVKREHKLMTVTRAP
jgi:hypothetical protein